MEMGNNLQNFKWIVYCTTCNVNNKIYIGVHKTETPYIFDGYIGGGWNINTQIKNPKTAYEYALKKYGYSAFTRQTLKVFDNHRDAYLLEEYLVDIDFVKRRDTYNTRTGGYGGGNYKSFYQYDTHGNLIKTWNSREELLAFYNLYHDVNRIHRAVIHKYMAFNSYWTTEYYDKLDVNEYRITKRSTIYYFNMDGELINSFENAKECADELNMSLHFVNEAINSKKHIKDGFLTKYPDKIIDIIKFYHDNKKLLDNAISLYDAQTQLKVDTFSGIKAINKKYGWSYKSIKSALHSGLSIQGFLLAYGFSDEFKTGSSNKLKIAQYDINGNLVKVWDTIAECAKVHPKVRMVLKGLRKQHHNFTFKILES